VKLINIILIAFVTVLATSSSYAAFPNDLEDVIFIEESTDSNPGGNIAGIADLMRSLPVTPNRTLSVTAGPVSSTFGPSIELDDGQRSAWPAGAANEQLSCCNANVWGFVFQDGEWFGGTWEFIRVGRTNRSLAAMVGPRHFRFNPLQNFRVRNGEVYGFMLAGITRNSGPGGTRRLNIRERSTVAFFQVGVGPVTPEEAFEILGIPFPGAAPDVQVPVGAIDILLQDDAPTSVSPVTTPLPTPTSVN